MSQRLLEAFESDPGSVACIELAREHIKKGDLKSAQHVLMRGLSANPNLDLARLLLAKVLFLQGYITFAVREVRDLRERKPELDVLKRLHQKLDPQGVSSNVPGANKSGPNAAVEKVSSVVAETDFEFSEIDLLEGKK